MYSVQDRSSFDQISAYWMEELKKEAPDAVINLVACKSDLGGRCVSTQEGMEYARSHPLHFEETSSKDDINIQKVFQNLVTGWPS
jgi:Ras-related protein Rab-39A/Ras-related protein Rab-39B